MHLLLFALHERDSRFRYRSVFGASGDESDGWCAGVNEIQARGWNVGGGSRGGGCGGGAVVPASSLWFQLVVGCTSKPG